MKSVTEEWSPNRDGGSREKAPYEGDEKVLSIDEDGEHVVSKSTELCMRLPDWMGKNRRG